MTDALSFLHRGRRSFRRVGLAVWALAFLPQALAQQAAPGAPSGFSPEQKYYNNLFGGMFPYLNPVQLLEFENALYPTLKKQPDLVADGVLILKEGGAKAGGTSPEEGLAYIKKFLAYEARLREAMTKQDKNIGIIFNQIDAHRARAAN